MGQSEYEKYISEHLDTFLQKHNNDMYNLPITSLYNIFYNKFRKLDDHNLGYQFIINGENKDVLYILLESLDCSKWNEKVFNDSILNQDEHFGFKPKIDLSSIKMNMEKIQQNFQDSIDRQNQQSDQIDLQQKLISQLEEKNQELMKTLDSKIFEQQKSINLLLSEKQKHDDFIKDPIKVCNDLVDEVVQLPTFVTKIPDFAFTNKQILTEIKIPASVTSIGSSS